MKNCSNLLTVWWTNQKDMISSLSFLLQIILSFYPERFWVSGNSLSSKSCIATRWNETLSNIWEDVSDQESSQKSYVLNFFSTSDAWQLEYDVLQTCYICHLIQIISFWERLEFHCPLCDHFYSNIVQTAFSASYINKTLEVIF